MTGEDDRDEEQGFINVKKITSFYNSFPDAINQESGTRRFFTYEPDVAEQ